MNVYGPTQAQTKEIAERRGCHVILEQQVHDGTWSQQVACPSPAAKVGLLADLANFDAQDPKQAPQLRRLAEQITAPSLPDKAAAADALRAWVRRNVAYVNEPVEIFSPAWRKESISQVFQTGSSVRTDPTPRPASWPFK